MNSKSLENYTNDPQFSELGKKTTYEERYNPDKLYFIPREYKRKEIGININHLPFKGFDCWNHYELSWLNEKGKPLVALAEFCYDCHSPFMVESKSFKLYLNSFNNSYFSSVNSVKDTLKKDLEQGLNTQVDINIQLLNDESRVSVQNNFEGKNLDNLDIACSEYTVNPKLLFTHNHYTEETVYSNLLKSNCLVTNQPDWGSVQIHYKGQAIDHENLLRYIVSFRNHKEFHEQCIERIFIDITNYCGPHSLTVYGRYTRRGGLDINPYRSTEKINFQGKNFRLIRQ